MENKNRLEEAIKTAQEAANVAVPEMREKAFEMVLAHLLNSSKSEKSSVSPMQPSDNSPSLAGFEFSRVATQLNLSEELVAELYEVDGAKIRVAIKPVGKRLSDQQRNLAYALMIGYKFGLNTKEVPITVFSEAADEWGIRDTNFGRNLKEAKGLQMRGGGKGKTPIYSLAPGAVEKIRDEV
jgi:hypothetical protein